MHIPREHLWGWSAMDVAVTIQTVPQIPGTNFMRPMNTPCPDHGE